MNYFRMTILTVKPYWKRSLVALLLLVILVGMDLAIPRLVQRIIDQGIAGGDQQLVLETSLVMIFLSILSAALAVGNNILSVQVGERVARDLRQALFLKIQTFSHGNLDRMKTGELMVRLASDTAAVQRWVLVSLRIGTRAPLLMAGSLLLMIHTSRQLAVTLLPLLVVTTAIVILFISKMEPLYRAVQLKLDWLNTVLQENIAGVRLIKAFARAAHEQERFGAANDAFTAHSTNVMRFMATMSPALSLCVNLGVVIVIWAGGIEFSRDGLTLGQVVAFTNYLMTTMTPLTLMTMLANTWARGTASAKRVSAVLDTVPDVYDAASASDLPASFSGRIEFDNVSFSYDSANDEQVLAGITLTAEPGQTVAILGATGAGKSTLVNLVPRFYDATAGRVLVDGIDVRQLRQQSLLSRVAIVPQETVLFSGTVRDNLRFGAPTASDDEVQAAAEAAQAHQFISELPDGYDSRIEERGVNLSGGQKQRIAIARALLTRPAILILDDSTSSVDVETETNIQQALQHQQFHPTTLIVAQRISTVLHADNIIVLDGGRIAAAGTHLSLLRSSPIYREIYDSQLGGGINGMEHGPESEAP